MECESRFMKKHGFLIDMDGVLYNKSIAQLHFPRAVHIIDLYHAFGHVHDLAALLVPERLRDTVETQWKDILDRGDVEQLVGRAAEFAPRDGGLRGIGYFTANAESMRYGDFRAKGYFVGSGVVEAACKSVVGAPIKNSGMFWSVEGANAIIALRCCVCSGRFEQFWEDRANKTH